MIYEVFAGNNFNLTQSVKSNPQVLVVEQPLTLQDTHIHNIRTRKNANAVVFRDQAQVRTSVKNVSVVDSLGLFHQAKKAPIYVEAFGIFFPYHTASGARGGSPESFFALSQSVNVFKPKSGKNTFALTHDVGLSVVRNRTVAQTFNIGNKSNVFKYDVNFILAPVDLAPITPALTVTFYYLGTTVVLKAPDFGNTLKLEFSRVNQKTRGNDSIIVRPDIWPRSKIQMLKFSYMTETQADKMKAFLRMTLGQYITYYDHLGRAWTSIILTPGAPIEQKMRNVFSLSIELQGERITP